MEAIRRRPHCLSDAESGRFLLAPRVYLSGGGGTVTGGTLTVAVTTGVETVAAGGATGAGAATGSVTAPTVLAAAAVGGDAGDMSRCGSDAAGAAAAVALELGSLVGAVRTAPSPPTAGRECWNDATSIARRTEA